MPILHEKKINLREASVVGSGPKKLLLGLFVDLFVKPVRGIGVAKSGREGLLKNSKSQKVTEKNLPDISADAAKW